MLPDHPENAILSAWRETLAFRADAPAVYAPDRTVLRTFRDVETEAEQLRTRLAEFHPGSVVGIQIGNDESWPALLVALFRQALIPLPLGRHVESAELEAALQTCGAAGLVTAANRKLSIQRLTGAAAQPWAGSAPDFLKLTSGTTSAPRAVCFRAHQLLADCDNILATMGISAADLNFGVIPFSHSYGFSNLVTPLVCRGVPLVASEDRLPRAILHDLERSGATVFPGMPVFFDKLAALPQVVALPRLRLCISAGAALPKAVAETFSTRFGVKIHTFYGSSECGGIGYDTSEALEYRDGFAGTPMRGVEIDHDPSGEPGPITVRGAAVGEGYYPEQDPEVLGGGRFTPGDLIRWTEDGMFLAGRSSDVINIAGRKLNPGEVEARIRNFPGVKQVVVFGVPSPLRGEEPVACVVAGEVNPADLVRFCRSQLSEWQQPRDVWMVDEIPVNERGKVSRRVLAEQYRAARS